MDDYHAKYGNMGTPSPEAMRQLTAAEKAHDCVWSWSPELATYTCEHFPKGIS